MSYKLASAGVDIFQFISWLGLELFCVGWNISWCGLELIHWPEIIRILGYSSISRTGGRMFTSCGVVTLPLYKLRDLKFMKTYIYVIHPLLGRSENQKSQ